jgi:5-methyltetrahydropteroyltriglutamate--homocysteine methyltransferase
MLLPTTVVGSYSVPEWLERLKTDFYQRRISAQHLKEIHDVAIKAALKDQELAGLDIVSDGELRRDNDIDYLLARIPGVDIPHRAKTDYYDYYDAQETKPLPAAIDGGPGLADDFTFTRDHTAKPIKFSFTGPFSLSRRIRDSAYTDPADLVGALARWLNAQAAGLAAAGAELLQIDEPFLAGYPEAAELAIAAVNTVTEGVDVSWALHVCYGNRYARPLWEGHYDFLFPACSRRASTSSCSSSPGRGQKTCACSASIRGIAASASASSLSRAARWNRRGMSATGSSAGWSSCPPSGWP